MRLLFVSHSFPPPGAPSENIGGMQRVATELSAAFAAHPDVMLETHLLETSWRWTHVRVVPYLLGLLWRIPRLVAEGRVEVVLFSSMVTAGVAPLLASWLRARGVRTAAIVHGRDVTLPLGLYQQLVPHVFAALDAVLPVSRATGEACLSRGLDAEKLYVVPNGIDVRRFAPLEAPATMRAAMLADEGVDLPDDHLLLLSVGRQVKRKGFAWFVDTVLPTLPENVHYWLAGEGPEAEAILAAARRHGLDGRVRLLGRVSDERLTRLYRGADLFVMPNIPVAGDMEGFGVVMLEAGLGGLPTVAARLEGIQDVITPGLNGHLLPSGDADAFRDAILSYHQSRDVLELAAHRAAEHVADTFSWTAVAERYVQVLRGL